MSPDRFAPYSTANFQEVQSLFDYTASLMHMFWLVCSSADLFAKQANRSTRKQALPIPWMNWRVNRNEAEILEWRPMIWSADLLATNIKWNCAAPSHNPHAFCLSQQINFSFANLWSFYDFLVISFGEVK